MQKLKKIIFAVSLGLLLANPTLVFAQGTNTSANGSGIKSNAIDVAEYKGVEGSISQYLCTPTEGADNGKDLEMCINKIYRFGIAFGAIALVFFIVFAGYLYITGGEQGKGRAKGIINNALVGMALLLGSYVILYFINPSLTVIKPIQPPIFSAPDLPTCDAVGFGEKCVIAGSGGGGISTGGNKCSVPVTASAQNGKYNNSLHGETGSGHGPVRTPPNGAPPLGTVDVGVKGGSPVYAAISGKVVKYGDLGTFGKYVSIISDPDGGEFGCEKSNACANQAHIEPTVKEGDMVTAGQQIGTMTNYTGSMGPHLHLELKLNGQWITGDGKKGTWDNMKAACAASGSSASSSSSGALTITNKLVSKGFKTATGRTIDTVLLHSTYNVKYGSDPYSVDGVIKQFQDYSTSPHFVIDRAGNVYQLVEEKNIASHAGAGKLPDGGTNINERSIGIELINKKTDNDTYTDAQYASLNSLLAKLKSENKIKYVTSHSETARAAGRTKVCNTDADLDPMCERTDPWNLDWSKVNR